MARSTKSTGWSLYKTEHGTYHVRFRHQGERIKLSTGKRTRREAQVEAARIFARVTAEGRVSRPTDALGDLVARWLVAIESELAPGTWERYGEQWEVHLLPYFLELGAVTPGNCDAYVRMRLDHVVASTVKKELSALRRFLDWCVRGGLLESMPDVRSPPKRALGTPASTKVKVELDREQVQAILAHLPERSRKGNTARPFFTVMWETGLRYATLCGLEAPGDYRRGWDSLRIRPEIDKARYGRTIPISEAASEALDSVFPNDGGLLFGAVDYRTLLQRAGADAGLSKHDAAHLSYHDFRHAALMDLGSRITDLTALAFLAGHKSVTTTAQYVRGREAGARRALEVRGDTRDTTPAKVVPIKRARKA